MIVSLHRGVEQLVARWAHNPKVAGSSPVPATLKPHKRGFFYVQRLRMILDAIEHFVVLFFSIFVSNRLM